jgi:hypothetical protein
MDLESQLLIKIEQLDEDLIKWFGEGKSSVRVSYKESLCEVFNVAHKDTFKKDLIQFLDNEFKQGDLTSVHQGLSTTDYQYKDWLETIADNIVNRLIQYFEATRGQTERNL